jgi:cell division protein FtsA
MRKDNLICGIDIGTSKVCVSVGRIADFRPPKILSVSSSSYPEKEAGPFIDFSELEHLLCKNFEYIRNELKTLPHRVYISFPPQRLKKYSGEATIPISTIPEKITRNDIQRALKVISGLHLSEAERILQILPREFFTDGRRCEGMPLGVYARRLQLKSDVVTIDYKILNELKTILSNLGFFIAGCTLPALATSFLLVPAEDKANGVILLDIGARITEIAYFRDGLIKSLDYIHRGGYDFTREISRHFDISLKKAEMLKKRYLSIDTPAMRSQEKIKIKNLPYPLSVSRNQFCETLKPQIESFIFKLDKRIRPRANFYGIKKIIVSGGSSLIEGFLDKMQTTFGININLTLAKPQISSRGNLNPAQHTSSGIICWIAERQHKEKNSKWRKRRNTGLFRLFSGLQKIYRDYF